MTDSSLAYSLVKAVIYPLFRSKVKDVHGLEQLPQSGGFLIAANHVDYLDGFYIAVVVGINLNTPVHFLTKTNNYWWTTLAVQIPKDNNGQIVDPAVKALKSGQVICNFPEGQRNDTDKLLPGKTGTVRMAALAGVPVVPLGITCSAGKNVTQSWQFRRSKNHPVSLRFGQPLTFQPPPELSREWLEQETDKLMSAIAPLCNKTI